jgi:hypothetical protein
MGRPKKVKRPETRRGPALLATFLARHDISLRVAEKALAVGHPTVWTWLQRRSVPKQHLRKRIAVWTGGFVPEDSWMARGEMIDVVPFSSTGTER